MDYAWSVCAHQMAFYDGHDIKPIEEFVKEFRGVDKKPLCWLEYDGFSKQWKLWQMNGHRSDHSYPQTIFENNYVINEGPYEGIVVIGEKAFNAKYYKEDPVKREKLAAESNFIGR